MPELSSREAYNAYVSSLDWENYYLDRDGHYGAGYRGPETIVLGEFALPIGVGALIKNRIAGGIVNKASENGATVTEVRFWSNTAGIFEDKYRIEVGAHDSPIAPLVIIGIITTVLAIIGFTVTMVLLAAAVYVVAGQAGSIAWALALGTVGVAGLYWLSKRGK